MRSFTLGDLSVSSSPLPPVISPLPWCLHPAVALQALIMHALAHSQTPSSPISVETVHALLMESSDIDRVNGIPVNVSVLHPSPFGYKIDVSGFNKHYGSGAGQRVLLQTSVRSGCERIAQFTRDFFSFGPRM